MRPGVKEISNQNRRILLIVLACILVGGLFLLAAGVGDMRFVADRPFRIPDPGGAQDSGGSPSWQIPPAVLLLFLGVLGLATVVAIFVIIRSPELRKKVLAYMLQALIFVAAYAIILSLLEPPERAQPVETAVVTQESAVIVPSDPGIEAPPLEPFSPRPTSLLTYLVTFGLLLLAGAVIVWVWYRLHPPRSTLGDIARTALDNLRMGRQWEDVVIQCYGDMSAAAFVQRGIDRPGSMTPAEFARRLEASGIPAAPVRTLTRLFEQARYGSRSSNSQEAKDAMAALSQIISSVDRKR